MSSPYVGYSDVTVWVKFFLGVQRRKKIHFSYSDFLHFWVTVHDHISRTFRDLPHNLLIWGAMRSREPLSHSSANSLAICAAATVAHGLFSLDTIEFLSGNMANPPPHAVMRKLQLIPEHTPISLALPSELPLRSSSAFCHVFRGQLTDISIRIADRSEARRTAQQGRVARRLKAMAACLDFARHGERFRRRLQDGCQTHHICMFARLALPLAPTCTVPFVSVGAAEQNGIALPADEVLASEFDPHARALRVASFEQLIGSSELDGAHDGCLHAAQVVRVLPELPLPLPALRAQGRARSDH
jgi:hypothetical protein